ncbi:MAG: glycosyltransferase family 39 protein [Nitrospinota bacterium]|nr:glycosyltransferase family 39 protein [Nitrospinota bacterium]
MNFRNLDRYPLAVALITLVGAGLRFFMLDRESFWYDEGLSDWFSRLPLATLWGEVPGYEIHPPLFYTLLKGWSALFGNSEAGLRSMSALLGTATIPLVYALGRLAGGESRGYSTGVVAAAIFALAPIQIAYAQDARPYTLLVFATTLALVGAFWLMAHPARAAAPLLGLRRGERTTGPDWQAARAWGALTAGAALALWAHNLGFTLVASLLATTLPGLLWIHRARRSFAVNAFLSGAIAFALWSPFLPWYLSQATNVSSSFWAKPLDMAVVGAGFNYVFFLFMTPFWIKALMLGMAGAGLLAINRERGGFFALVLGGVIMIPFALEIGLSLAVKPIFVPRTLIWTFVPFSVAVGAALAPSFRWIYKAPLVLLLVVGLTQGVWGRFHHQKEPWRQVVAMVVEKAGPNDVVLTIPNSVAIPFEYYSSRLNPGLEIIPLPAPFPATGMDRPYPSGNMAEPGFTRADSVVFDELDCETSSIWLVTRFRWLYDPQLIAFENLFEKCDLIESGGYPALHVARFGKKKPEPVTAP